MRKNKVFREVMKRKYRRRIQPISILRKFKQGSKKGEVQERTLQQVNSVAVKK
jgi:hypothetical protein